MSNSDPTVALLTERRYVEPSPGTGYVENIFEEDRLVCEGLQRRGIVATRVDWADPTVDWGRFDAAVFRTTWDYFERFEAFTAWLDRVQSEVTLVNPAPLVRWNWDKHYLLELRDAGVPIVPTDMFEVGASVQLEEHLRHRGWDEAVIKPAVSGAARHTYRVRADDCGAAQARLDTLLGFEAMMVQPFMADIVSRGEVTVVFVQDQMTHAIVKRAKAGDFRVQDDFGGTVHAHAMTPDEEAFARRAIAACPCAPLYGRADLCRDADGSLRLMELELIEPELWFRHHPPAADAFAQALADRLRPGDSDRL